MTEPPSAERPPLVDSATTAPPWWQRHGPKLLALLFWLTLIGASQWYASRHNLSPLAAVQSIIDLLATSVYGPLLYIAIYALRPLILFSAVLLTLAGGYLFGPVLGVVYTIIGSNLSAMVAYLVGRYFGQGILADRSAGTIQRYAEQLRHNSFETILIMRFIFLPYDFVNYLAGFLHINWKAFILATALGSLPGTVSFVLFGASIEGDFTGSTPSLNPAVLGLSIALFVVSLALSRYFKQRAPALTTTAPARDAGAS